MSKAGSTYKRCRDCGANVPKDTDGSCGKCEARVSSHRNVTWSFRVDVPSPDGKRKQRSGHGFDTQAEAQGALDTLKAEVAEGRYVERDTKTVGEWLDAWLVAIRHDVSAGTWESYDGHVRNYLKPRIGDVSLQELSRTTVKTMLADLRDNGRIRGEGGLAAKTVHNVYLTLHVALEAAVEDRKLPRNPADDAHKLTKDDKPEMSWWTHEQMDAFLRRVRGDEFYAMWHVFCWTGARRGEIAAMQWRDVDLDAGTWSIERQWRKGIDGQPGYAATKGGKRRTIALVPETVAALRHHRAEQAKLKLMLGEEYRDSGLVFAMPDGQPMHPDGISQRWDRHVRDSGLPRIRPHDARHTHATWCLANGMPTHVVSKRLGHSSIQVTVDMYGHADEQMQHDALGAALKRAAQ